VTEMIWRKSSYSGQGNCVEVGWRKSSHSGQGNCVEVASRSTPSVLVRDTRDRTGPVLTFPSHAWRTFATQLKAKAGYPTA
jgi:hypothetical protein